MCYGWWRTSSSWLLSCTHTFQSGFMPSCRVFHSWRLCATGHFMSHNRVTASGSSNMIAYNKSVNHCGCGLLVYWLPPTEDGWCCTHPHPLSCPSLLCTCLPAWIRNLLRKCHLSTFKFSHTRHTPLQISQQQLHIVQSMVSCCGGGKVETQSH